MLEDKVDEILAKVQLFSGIKEDREALRVLADNMVLKSFPAGTVLIEEGKLGDEFFVLVDGEASIYKSTPDGDVFKVFILKQEMTPGFGEGGLIEAEPRSATVKCDRDSKCFVLGREKFFKFCEDHPKWAVPILQKISIALIGRLRQTSNDLMLLHKALMNEIKGA